MFNKTMTALGFVMIAATPALAVDGPFPVGEVDANTYFESMANPNAMKFYPDVAVDIGNAVRARADMAGEDAVSLGLTGGETFDITGHKDASATEVSVTATPETGDPIVFKASVRIDTPKERDYYEHGGILQYVLRQLANAA